MDLKRPRKLNFNAPLLSTKRLGYSGIADPSCTLNSLDTLQNMRVPFSWEQVPGKPKDMERSDSIHDGDTPRPRLPPCLWRPLKEAAEADALNGVLAFNHDDGCDGDDDEDDSDKKNDVFSDALGVLSLSEAFDIIQQSEAAHSGSNDGLKSKLAECNGDQSPTYMIKRFLPDANALAASSVSHFSNDFDNGVCDTWSHGAFLTGSARQSCASSPKGCGFGILFSWRMKHKFCAMKNPVLPCSTNVQKHQYNLKHKKHCSYQHGVIPLGDNRIP